MNDRQQKILSRGLFALSPVLFLAGAFGAVDNRQGGAVFGLGLISACISVVGGLYVRAGGAATDTPLPPASIASMTLAQVVHCVATLPDTVPTQYGTALTKRLCEIVYFDHHVPNEDRANALQLLLAVKATTEASLRSHPSLLAAYQQANQFMGDNVPRLGIGSLSWLLVERDIPKADIVAFAARPEHSDLLPDFYLALGEPAAIVLKGAIAEHLGSARG